MNFRNVLNNIDEIIYISDVETYELTFINTYGQKIFGKPKNNEKCYEYLQGYHAPCAFCTNKSLLEKEDQRCTWIRRHPQKGEFLLQDSIIELDGKLQRMEVAINITKYVSDFDIALELSVEKKLFGSFKKL